MRWWNDRGPRPMIRRVAGGDLMQWQSDVGPFPQHVGALLLLAPGGAGPCDVDRLVAVLVRRLGTLEVLNRRPVRAPPGCGGPYWADDDRDPAAHVAVRSVDGDLDALLDVTGELLAHRMPPGRSPWRATVLTTDDRPRAVLLVLHHVLVDGLAGMTALTALLDPGGPPVGSARPAAARRPTVAALCADATASRLRAVGGLRRLPTTWRALRAARGELGTGRARASRSVLNRPTGARRVLRLVDVPEPPLRGVAHAAGGSVNDVLLVAVGQVLATVAAGHGELLDPVLVSVPVAVRAGAARGRAGNAVGVMPVPVPTSGSFDHRLRQVTRVRRERLSARAAERGGSQPLVLAAFRVLRALHLVRAFSTRQRLVNTFVSALPPLGPLPALAGHPVAALVPLVVGQGNVTIAFAALRHRDRLRVTVIGDPDVGPPVDAVAAGLRAALTVGDRSGIPVRPSS